MQKYELWYKKPAPAVDDGVPFYTFKRGWEKFALPIGNGYFGATLLGRLEVERVGITENSLVNPYTHPDINRKVRCATGVMSFCELLFDINHSLATNYKRGLDLNRALAYVSYDYEGVGYKREAFISHPDRVLVMRFSADREKSVTLGIHPEVPFISPDAFAAGDGLGREANVSAEGDIISIRGLAYANNIIYEGRLKVVADGGESVVDEYGRIWIDGADSVTVIFTADTNYELKSEVFLESVSKKKLDGCADPHESVCRIIDEASKYSFDELLSRHVSDYKSLFDRADVKLSEEDVPLIPTDELLKKYNEGEESRYLEALLFQYGRYMLIASSRGYLPANLQGIWNPYSIAPWSNGIWHNINVQMNYWPACPTNLAETFIPYIEYAKAYMKSAMSFADDYVREYYPERLSEPGKNGWILGTAASPYYISPMDFGHSGPGTGAFTSLLFWDYYDYTKDEDFLREFCYPALRGMSLFFSKTLEKIDGKMLVKHSASPEQRENGVYYRTVGCAFDQQMIYENDKRTLDAAAVLGIEEPLLDEIRQRMPLLDNVLLGDDGQIKEYREETTYGSIGEALHRHVSHLVGLYPGTQINATTPEWIEGAKVTLDRRGEKTMGWAVAHRMLLRARTKSPEGAMRLVRSLFKYNINENLWDAHPPFQVDGNFGYTVGVCEMLLQSQAGYIELLPALPTEWRSGEFTGLVARGGFVVSATWRDGALLRASVESRCGGELKIELPECTVCGAKFGGGIYCKQTAKGEILNIVI